MTNFLIRICLRDNQDFKDKKVREKCGVLASITGIICNILLFVVKLLIGLFLGSISVMADAFNNLSDAASSIVGFVGVKLANRPSDEEHPYGHGRYEYVAAFIVAFLVLEVGFSCLKSAVDKIKNPTALSFSPILIGILVLSVFVKLWLGLLNRKLGKMVNSSVMKATAADAFGDMLITSVTAISIVVGHVSGLLIDGYMGLIVSIIVMYAGVGIIRETLKPLIGEAPCKELCQEITRFVESFDGIIGTHDLIIHNYGPSSYMATIHAEVPIDSDLGATHELVDAIERKAEVELGICLVIHMDPAETDNPEVKECKEMVALCAKELVESATIHDFRMVRGDEQINLIFDLVLPHGFIGAKREQVLTRLQEKVDEKKKGYHCIITVDHSFVN